MLALAARAVRWDRDLLLDHGLVEGSGGGFEDGADFCRPFETAARLMGVRLAGVTSRNGTTGHVHMLA